MANLSANGNGLEVNKIIMRLAMKHAGLPAIERWCRLTRYNGKMVKAYRVPGTPEAGRYEMACRMRDEYIKSRERVDQ